MIFTLKNLNALISCDAIIHDLLWEEETGKKHSSLKRHPWALCLYVCVLICISYDLIVFAGRVNPLTDNCFLISIYLKGEQISDSK